MGIFAQLWEVYKERGSEVMVHRTVNTKLGSDGDAPAVAAFTREAEVFLADEDMLLLMLSVGLDGLYETQFSFVGVLLREEVLQPKLVDILLEKLAEFSASMDAQFMEKNVPKLILRELRWMDLVVDSRQLIAKLIGALPAFSVSLQRDIIYILPELASDEDSVLVVNTLLDLIRSEAALVTCCIEALGNFNVLTDQTSAVVECVLERLDSSPLADLPAIVKYLVQEARTTDVEQIVDQLREQLSTTLAFHDSAATASQASSNDEALILGSIIQGFYFREELARTFAARIQTVERLKLLDLWILFGVTSIPQHQAKMEKLFLKKIQGGLINTDLLVRGIAAHGNALQTYFPSILSLAGKLLMQSSDASCVQMGSVLYELLFEEFSVGSTDASSNTRIAYYQGEIVSALLGHCLASGGTAAIPALDTLCSLVSPKSSFVGVAGANDARYTQRPSKRRERLDMFLPALKQMLDTMENCSVPQVRKMYDVLFAVGGHEDSDLCNILLKQAFHQETRYRCFGILGAVSRLGRLLEFFREATALTARGGTGDADTGREPLKTSAAKEFTVCMTELHRSYLSDTKCFAFMLEELTDFSEKLELDELGLVLVSNIFNYYLEFFQTRFMEDFDVAHSAQYSKTVLSGAMKSELWLNIDAKKAPVYLKILDLVLSPNFADQEALLYLNSLVSLLLTIAQKRRQVGEIECILICPVQMMEESVLRELSALDRSVQNAVCTTLWHAINWVRSIINFFSTEAKNYYVAKTTERLENLSRLETILLDEVLPSCPAFAVPGLSGGGIDQRQSLGKAKSLFDPTERKKPGRPPKVSTTVDRATLVKKSFLPLKSEVISILAFPRVLDSVIRGGRNDRLETAGDERSSGFALKTVRIELLFSLFRYHMDWCAEEEKPKSSFSWGTVAHTAGRKENVLAHGVASKSSSKLLAELSTAGVLNATEKYACHFLAVVKEHGEDESASEDEETKEGDQPAPSTSLVKRILCEYLEIMVLFLNRERGASKNDPAADVIHMQQLQSLLLPESERAEYTSSDSNSLIKITSKCFKVMLQYRSVVGDNIEAGVALLKCLTSLLSLTYGFDASQVINYATSIDLSGRQQRGTNSTKSAMATQLNNLALSYLQRDWSNGDSRYAYKNAHLEVILRCCIHHDPIVLDRIQTLAIDGFVELLEQNGKRVEGYPTLDKKTVGIYHRVMFDALVAVTSRLDVSSNDERFVFNYLMQAVLLFKMLVCITKGFHKAMLIGTVLKVGRKFIEMFLRIMPFLEEQFQLHSSRVVKLFSEVQVATRRMQVLCAHGKLVKDQATASQVPMVKKLLEKLIYRGEMLASANGVLHAYKTGVLRSKRLDGTTISQEQDSDDSSEEDEASEKDGDSGGEEGETQVGEEEETQTDEGLPCDEEAGEQEEKDEEGAPPAAKRSR